MSDLELALQNIEIDYYRSSENFDNYTLEEYVEAMLEDYL